MSKSTKWLQKKRLEVSTLQEEAEKLRQLAAGAAVEAISSELEVFEDKLSSALEAEAKRKEKLRIHNLTKLTKGIFLWLRFIQSVTLILCCSP